jgi:hypothetical protein
MDRRGRIVTRRHTGPLDNQPMLWTGPRRVGMPFYSSARSARRVAGQRTSSVIKHRQTGRKIKATTNRHDSSPIHSCPLVPIRGGLFSASKEVLENQAMLWTVPRAVKKLLALTPAATVGAATRTDAAIGCAALVLLVRQAERV